jgi:uncharacterized protein
MEVASPVRAMRELLNREKCGFNLGMIGKVIVQDSKIHGRGLFAARDIGEGEVIIDWALCKENLADEDVKLLTIEERKRVSVIDGQLVLFKPPACWVNHSCNANARGTEGRDVATRVIKESEEITVDYVLENVPDLNLRCNCGSQNCRGFLRSTGLHRAGP